MGVPWGAPDDLNTLMAMVNNIPDGWTFSAFGLGRHQMPVSYTHLTLPTILLV